MIASGRLEEALAVLEEALTLISGSGFEQYTSSARLQQAELLLVMGSTSAAYEHARLIKERCEAQGLVVHAIRAGLVMAAALLEMSQQSGVDQEQRSALLQEAEMLCKETITGARQHNLQESIYKGHYLLGRLFVVQQNPGKAARRYRAAIAQIERILDDLVYDLSPSFLHSTWTVYEEMIALCLRQAQTEYAFGYLEQARSMALRQYLNKSSALRGKSEEQQDIAAPSISQTSSAQLLRIQQNLKDWQERYRNYSVILADIDTSVSPSVDRAIIQDEMKRCEEEISQLFERFYLYESGTALKTYTKDHAPRQVQQVDLERLRQRLSPDQLLLTYFLYKGKLVIFAATSKDLVTHEITDGMEQLERLLRSAAGFDDRLQAFAFLGEDFVLATRLGVELGEGGTRLALGFDAALFRLGFRLDDDAGFLGLGRRFDGGAALGFDALGLGQGGLGHRPVLGLLHGGLSLALAGLADLVGLSLLHL